MGIRVLWASPPAAFLTQATAISHHDHIDNSLKDSKGPPVTPKYPQVYMQTPQQVYGIFLVFLPKLSLSSCPFSTPRTCQHVPHSNSKELLLLFSMCLSLFPLCPLHFCCLVWSVSLLHSQLTSANACHPGT